jgi:hypothetical protein
VSTLPKTRQQTAFARSRSKRYLPVMKTAAERHVSPLIKIGLAVVTIAAATGIAFAAWVENGAQILMTMAVTGLSWCF